MSCAYCGDEHPSLSCHYSQLPKTEANSVITRVMGVGPAATPTITVGPRPAATPEPPPVPNDKPALWDLVIGDIQAMDLGTLGTWATIVHDMMARDAFGRAKYGTPLQAGNGRDAIVDAYQEALDLCVYLKQALVEKYDGRVWALYHDALNQVIGLAALVSERGGACIACERNKVVAEDE